MADELKIPNFPADLRRRLKVRAATESMTLKAFVERELERALVIAVQRDISKAHHDNEP